MGAAAMMACAPACAADLTANPDNEPFPITADAKPSTVVVGTAVLLSGSTLALLNNDVVITIASPTSTPPQSSRLAATRSADGSFKISYVPKVAGTYTVDALAPDGKGHAAASFTVEDPRHLSQPAAQALGNLGQDADQIIQIVRKQIKNVPASPARDEAEQKLTALTQSMGEFVQLGKDVSQGTGQLITITQNLPPVSEPPSNAGSGSGAGNTTGGGNFTMGGGGTVAANTSLGGVGGNAEQRLSRDREAVVEMLGEASKIHERSQEEIKKLAQEQVTCDNLEKAAEGIKFAGVIMNFAASAAGIVKNFAQDFAAAAAAYGAERVSGNSYAGFLAGQAPKNYDTLSRTVVDKAQKWTVDAFNLASSALDIVGFVLDKFMDHYCEQFSGPVRAHMHATFKKDGRPWWEYSFDVVGQITLHYPKGATSGSVPLKGRIEGFATNYKLWENALTVMFPELMVSAVQQHAYILPMAPTGNIQVYGATKLRDVEGSVLGTAATPSSFFFEVNGTATPDELDIRIGPQNIDTNARAKVIDLYASVLSLSMGFAVYSLPYKPVHFIFERANGTYPIPLSTQKKVIRGKQHFENKLGDSQRFGEYSVDIEACNPDC